MKLLVKNFSRLPVFGIAIGDAAQLLWVRRGRLERGKNHRLIRVHARASVYRVGGAAFEKDVAFAARHEEGRAERELVEPLKIDIGAVHDIEGFRPRVRSGRAC